MTVLTRATVQLPLEDTEVDARQYDDERAETGGFGAGAGKVQARLPTRPDEYCMCHARGGLGCSTRGFVAAARPPGCHCSHWREGSAAAIPPAGQLCAPTAPPPHGH